MGGRVAEKFRVFLNCEMEWRRFASLLMGLALMQSIRITVTGAEYAARRFGMDVGELGIYLRMTLNTEELFFVLGTVTMTAYLMLRAIKGCKQYDKNISVILAWTNVAVFVAILYAYTTGGEKGHLTLYYWTLILASLVHGMFQSMMLNMLGEEIAYFLIGIPLSAGEALFYHLVMKFLNRYKIPGMEYYMVTLQIIISIMMWVIAAGFWTYGFREYKPDTDQTIESSYQEIKTDSGYTMITIESMKNDLGMSFSERFRAAASPFLMNILASGLIYFFYPSLAPYEFVDEEVQYYLDLLVLVCSVIIAFILVSTVQYDVGPNRPWKGVFRFYHGFWYLFFLYYWCMAVFLFLLHSPRSPLSLAIRQSPGTICALTLAMKGANDILVGVSTTAISMQRNVRDGDILSIANCLSTLLATLFSFLGQGYVRAYRSYTRDASEWPTTGFGPLGAFLFWLVESTQGGWEMFMQCFTLDVREYFEIKDPDKMWKILESIPGKTEKI